MSHQMSLPTNNANFVYSRIPKVETHWCHWTDSLPTRVIAWVLRFIHNWRVSRILRDSQNLRDNQNLLPLSVEEIVKAENYWISYSQTECFGKEIEALNSSHRLPSDNPLISLHAFLDSNKILRVSGRDQSSRLAYQAMHSVILHGKHAMTKLIIVAEHLNSRFHIIGGCKSVVRSHAVALFAVAILSVR